MTKKHKEQVIILSGELSTLTQEKNQRRTITLGACLESLDFTFKKVSGCYNGIKEVSFLVIPRNNTEIDILKGLAFTKFGQESVLYQDTTGHCFLEYPNDTSEKIGRFEEITNADNIQNYTIINGKAFTVR